MFYYDFNVVSHAQMATNELNVIRKSSILRQLVSFSEINYPNFEKTDIAECYILCNLNAAQAVQEYFERYSYRRQFSLSTYGYFNKPKEPSNDINEVAETNVLACIFQNPS